MPYDTIIYDAVVSDATVCDEIHWYMMKLYMIQYDVQ